MSLNRIKMTIAIVWLLAAGVIGVALNVRSAWGGIVLAAFGLVPPLAVLLLWNEPGQTMSESIDRARR